MRNIEINGKVYTMRVDMRMLEAVEERFGSLSAINNGKMSTMMVIGMMAINEANHYDSSCPGITKQEIETLSLAHMKKIAAGVKLAIEDSMKLESDVEKKEVPRDLYMEELEKNG